MGRHPTSEGTRMSTEAALLAAIAADPDASQKKLRERFGRKVEFGRIERGTF